MRNKFILGLLFLLISGFLRAQGFAKGQVVDAATRESLAGVNVSIGANKGTVTDAQGRFMIETDTGKVVLTFSYVGYAPQRRSFIMVRGDTLRLSIELIPEASAIDQIVISASRAEQKISELSVSMDIIKPSAIEQKHMLRSDELLNRSTGIEVFDGQASVRGGSGFSYGAGSRVMALVDGLPVISPDGGNIRWQFLPMENISQVEIIKGASSVLYGSSALNGVINFRSEEPGIRPVTRYYAEAGIYDQPQNLKWKWWNKPRTFYSSSYSHLLKKGNNDFSIGAFSLWDNGYRWLNDEKLGRLNLRVQHHSPVVNGLRYGLNFNIGYTAKTDFILWQDADSGALKQNPETAEQLFSPFVTLDPSLTYQKQGGARHEIRMRLLYGENSFIINRNNNSTSLAGYTEYQYSRKLGARMNIIAGTAGNFSRIASRFYGDHQFLNLSGFTQLEVIPFERLKLTGGFRLEDYALDAENHQLVPVFRAGMNLRLADLTFLRASYGQGYRFPSIAEKFANTSLGSITIFPSPDIQPESGWSSELGLRQGLFSQFLNGQIDLAFFYSENHQLIEYVFGSYPDPVTSEFRYGFKASNTENSRVYGVETEIQSGWNAGTAKMNGSVGYTWMVPVQFNNITGKNTGEYLKYRRKHSLKMDLSSGWQHFSTGLTGMVRSPILKIDDVFLSPLSRETILPGFYDYWLTHNKTYLVLDLNIAWRINACYTISMAVKNLANTAYMGRPGDIQPQRNFSIRLSADL